MSCPPFSTCSDCGDEGFPVQTVQVPYCGQTESSDPCVSNKGKFHDRLTEDFIVPKVGNQTKIYICDAKLWAKCQWVGICNGADKIAAYPIMEVGNKTITILNGCRSGESIFGNPDVGKEFSTGTVLYPIPPQGCDSNFCERVAEAIRTCGAEGVYDLLKNSEEICFTTVSELDESERGHLFLGTMPDPCNCPSEYGGGEGEGSVGQGEGFWRSCLRKATKIFSNLGGRTLCFADMPTYNKDNDPNEIGRELVLDQKGCISRGASLNACSSTLDVGEEGADAIIACANGSKGIIAAGCNKIIIGCCDEDDDNPKWKSVDKGLMLHLLETPILVYETAMPSFGVSSVPTATAVPVSLSQQKVIDTSLIPEACGNGKVYALVDAYGRLVDTASGGFNIDVSYNSAYYRKIALNAVGEATSFSWQDIVPLNDTNPQNFDLLWAKLAGTGNYRLRVRILGFYV